MKENKKYNQQLLKARDYCSTGEKCIADMQKKMMIWGVSADDSDKIIRQLIQEKFIDEDRFAKAFVRDKLHFNQWGKVKINYQLKQKKIPAPVISKALKLIENEEYMQMLRAIITKKKQFAKSRSPYDLKAKILRFMQSKGFESDLVLEILAEE